MSVATELPLVYACSGASSAAQMANHLAVRLDRMRLGDMSCIAGVGGGVKPLVRTARSGRPIVALDGCPLHCAARILEREGIRAELHYDLSRMGVAKRYHEDFDPAEAERVLDGVRRDVEAAREVWSFRGGRSMVGSHAQGGHEGRGRVRDDSPGGAGGEGGVGEVSGGPGPAGARG